MTSKLSLYIKSTRPEGALFYTFITVCTIIAAPSLFGVSSSLIQSVQMIIIIGLFSLYGFCSNNFFDKEIDSINPVKKNVNPYSTGDISKTEIVIINLLLIFSVISATYIWFPVHLTVITLSIFAVSIYSAYLKRIPILDLISHFTCVFPFFVFPALVMGISTYKIIIMSLMIFGVSNITELAENQTGDREYDRKTGVMSTTVVFGESISRQISYLSVLLIACVILVFWYVFTNLWMILFIPAVLISVFRIKRANFIDRNFKKILIIYLACLLGIFLINSIFML